MRVLLAAAVLSLLAASAACAQSVAPQQNAAPPRGPELLGMQLAQALQTFGAPSHIYPIRGDRPWQDDVVFFYSTHLYLYWYDDRVWQIRFDRNFEGSFLNLSMGDSRTDAERVLGKPVTSRDDWEIFQLADRGFPVRARLFFTADRISDVYIYRSDF